MSGFLTVKNWQRFQHYKDRKPPWIKLYRDILDDRVYLSLPAASMALAPCIWLIASENDGKISDSPADLAFRVRRSEGFCTAALQALVAAGFLKGCVDTGSKTLAIRSQGALPERETERETETEKTNTSNFDLWYSDYFRKEKQPEARRAWDKLNKLEKEKALVKVRPWCKWKTRTEDPKFRPLPASWLNGKRFDDEIPPEPGQLCSRCGKEPRRADSEMGEECFKRLGLEGGGDD